MVPKALEAWPTATMRVRSLMTSSRASSFKVQSPGSISSQRITAPFSCRNSQGAMLASWSRRVTTISSPAFRDRAQGAGQVQRQGGHVGAEDDLAGRAGVDEIGHGLARLGDDAVAALRGGKKAVLVGIGVPIIRGHGVDDRLRHLGAARAVEKDGSRGQGRELGADIA